MPSEASHRRPWRWPGGDSGTIPLRGTFAEVRQAAELPGQPEGTWEQIRTSLFGQIQDSRQLPMLVQTLLVTRDAISAAYGYVALLQHRKRTEVEYWTEMYGPQVANAVDGEAPELAVRVWEQLAEHRIEFRNRPSYKRAAEYLGQAREVCREHGLMEEWKALIAGVRERYPNLRALNDELDAHDL